MKLPGYLPLVIGALFVVFFILEKLRPLRENRTSLLVRLTVNLSFSALAFLTAANVVRPSGLLALQWASQSSSGIVNLLPIPSFSRFILSFLLLDLTFYYWHLVNHKAPLLWRFHNVHHLDPDLDVSTGFRFHFGEVLLSTVFRVAQVVVIGVPFAAFAAYELIFQANTLFHHSNLRLPLRFERLLNRLLVTPRMHGIHHSQMRPETNSNFGVVFPWWDKLHRTILLNVPQSSIEIGIPAYSTPDDNRFWQVLTLPFRKQRDYWRKPDGSIPERDTSALKPDPQCLAE